MLDLSRRCVKDRAPFVSLLRTRFRVVISDDPDFVIYSDGSSIHRLYADTKIYWTPEVDRPDFRECDYALTTHSVDDPCHLRLPLCASG